MGARLKRFRFGAKRASPSPEEKLRSIMIDRYELGSIIIGGKKYVDDVIILPEKIIDGWRRKESHRLSVDDLKDILARQPKPDVFVVGTGFYGRVKVPSQVVSALESRGIELVVEPTHLASKTFNRLLESGKNAVAAFHLAS